MKVQIVSHTVPSPSIQEKGIETLGDYIAYVARVSNPTNQYNTQTTKRLLNYLRNNGHWSPFEMASVCMEINTTRDIARQMLRHRSFSFQEFSQRYAEVDEAPINRDARLQDPKNRQNSLETDDPELMRAWSWYQREVAKQSERAYTWAIRNGIAKEQARAVLPEGMTPSRLYMNGTVRSWMHYVSVRSGKETQKEHAEIARECGRLLGTLGIVTEGSFHGFE